MKDSRNILHISTLQITDSKNNIINVQIRKTLSNYYMKLSHSLSSCSLSHFFFFSFCSKALKQSESANTH